MKLGIVELYCGKSGKKGYYNSQEVGIARAMKRRGYSVAIFYPRVDIDSVQEEVVEADISIVYCPAKAIGVHARYDWNVLLRYQVDIVQIGSDNQLFLPNLISFCKKYQIKYYNYIGTIESDSKNKIKKRTIDLLFKRNLSIYRNSKCFVKTKYVYKQLEALGVSNLELMPVGLDISIIPQIDVSRWKMKEKLQLPLNKQVVLFVGRIDEYKRPLEIIKLIKKLADKYYFVIIGTGELNDELSIHLKEIKNCLYRWIKRIPNEEIHEYYFVGDYFVNFNNHEIFGMSILEAMYHGCTVIANQAPGPDMIIENRESGFLVNNTEEMIELINRNEKIVSDKARRRIEEKFIWYRTTDSVCKWIETSNDVKE